MDYLLMIPGEVFTPESEIELNADREAIALDVANSGDRPIQVGSHFGFFEVNRALQFDRNQAFNRRLDIPAGTAVRFEPGETKTVHLIPIFGDHKVFGLNALSNGASTCNDEVTARLKNWEQLS